MSTPIDAAVTQLKSRGLLVTEGSPGTLCIATSVVATALGVSVAKDATFLIEQGKKWLAVFPARGQCTFEVSGTLEELTDLVLSVYRDFHGNGGGLNDAFMRVVPLHEPFLRGAASPPALADAKSR